MQNTITIDARAYEALRAVAEHALTMADPAYLNGDLDWQHIVHEWEQIVLEARAALNQEVPQ